MKCSDIELLRRGGEEGSFSLLGVDLINFGGEGEKAYEKQGF